MTEPTERAEIENRDPATTALLERIIVPDHRPDFWDELTLQMEHVDTATVVVDRRFGRRSAGRTPQRLLLAAAVIIVVVVGAGALAALSGIGGDQAIDAGPIADGDGAADPDGTPPRRTEARGADAEWFFGNQMVWADGRFVSGFSATESGQNDSAHWTSPDGVAWDRQDGPSAAVVDPFVCPAGYRCDVEPTAAPIPYHYARSAYEVMARAGDTVLFRASVHYTIDGQDPAAEGQDSGPGPGRHPDLLAAAAGTDPCFAEVQAQGQPQGLGWDGNVAYLSSWSSGGLDDPVIRLTCQRGSSIADFTLDLREQLTQDQIERVYSFGVDSELWVERPGPSASRVPAAPTATYWADGQRGGVEARQLADIGSTGDRFWAASDGTVVTSTDGVTWTPVAVPTAGPDSALAPTRVAASPGGHIVVRMATDQRDWNDDRWFSISHDDGVSWSVPFEVPAELGSLSYQTDVGPAGAAVITFDDGGPEPRYKLTLVDDGAVRFTVDLPSDTCCELVAVGDDRVILRHNEILDVYLADGTLVNETVWVGDGGGLPTGWLRVPLMILALVAAATVIGFLGTRTRGRARLPVD